LAVGKARKTYTYGRFFVVNNIPIPTDPIVTEFSLLVKTTWFYLRILAVGIELIQNKKIKI